MGYDVIICGAGSAGAILASRFSEDSRCSVLLLEAGPDYPDPDTRPDELKYALVTGRDITRSAYSWQSEGILTAERKTLVARGKVTGGSSAISGPTSLRGVPEDYDEWARQGNDRWSFQHVLPAFRGLETDTDFSDDVHGAEGRVVIGRFKRQDWLPPQVAFYEACRAAGFSDSPDLNHPDSTGVGATPMNSLDDRRWSTALGYLARVRHRANLMIQPRCEVRRVLFAGNRAYGVEVECDGTVRTVLGDEVILSGGAIGSPHILMLSGVGPAECLRRAGLPTVLDSPAVGRNLTDHPTVSIVFRTRDGVTLDAQAPLRQVTLRYTAAGSDLRNDMKINAQSYVGHPDGGRPLGISLRASVNLAAAKGEVRLRSASADVQPTVNFHFLEDEFDRQRLREAVRICASLGTHPQFQTLVEGRVSPADADLASDRALDDWLRRGVGTSQHFAGTCRMGPVTDPTAVVDQYGVVHGLERLRVIDASIMPTSVRANTNLTTMMLAERTADLIRAGH